MTTLNKIQELAHWLINQDFKITSITGKTYTYNASDFGYTFRFDQAKRRFGCCNYGTKEITLSKHLCEANPHQIDKKIKDTILHELAHAFCVEMYGVRDGRGHDHKWVNIAKQIGCTGRRCYTMEDFGGLNKPKSKYTGVCKVHGEVSTYHRKPRLSRSCVKCSPNGYSEEHKIEIVKNY